MIERRGWRCEMFLPPLKQACVGPRFYCGGAGSGAEFFEVQADGEEGGGGSGFEQAPGEHVMVQAERRIEEPDGCANKPYPIPVALHFNL